MRAYVHTESNDTEQQGSEKLRFSLHIPQQCGPPEPLSFSTRTFMSACPHSHQTSHPVITEPLRAPLGTISLMFAHKHPLQNQNLRSTNPFGPYFPQHHSLARPQQPNLIAPFDSLSSPTTSCQIASIAARCKSAQLLRLNSVIALLQYFYITKDCFAYRT